MRTASFVVMFLVAGIAGKVEASRAYHRGSHHGPPVPFPVQLMVTIGAFQPQLGDARFTDSSGRRNGVPVGEVSVYGHEFGASRPVFGDLGFHFGTLWRHVVFGGVGGMLYGRPESSASSPLVSSSSTITGMYLGPELGVAWSRLGFDVHAGVSAGFLRFEVPLLGFDTYRCGRNMLGTCIETANVDRGFVRPVLALGYHHGFVGGGGYVSGDATQRGDWAAGAYVEVVTEDWRTLTRVLR